jgi:hypothetical protein
VQVSRCRNTGFACVASFAVADQAGIIIPRFYEEKGVSGTKGEEDRPAFQEMLTAILSNGVRAVIVERLDRLAREYVVQEQLLVYLAAKGGHPLERLNWRECHRSGQGRPYEKSGYPDSGRVCRVGKIAAGEPARQGQRAEAGGEWQMRRRERRKF